MTPEEPVFDYRKAHSHGFELYEGTALDERTVVASMPKDVKNGLRVDEVAWHRFAHAYGPAHDVPERLRLLRSRDSVTVDLALELLWGSVAHPGTIGSATPLTVPFLLRVAAESSVHGRVGALGLATAVARRQHWGSGTCEAILEVATDELIIDCADYAMNWSIAASRDAVTADADLLLRLLHDTDPEVRTATRYTLATASGDARRLTGALQARLGIEEAPRVRASLVLAVAELGREHGLGNTAARARALWTDPAQPADVRTPAALAWFCVVTDPVPGNLREMLEVLASDDLADVLADLPWIEHVGEQGLKRTIDQMLNNTKPSTDWVDPWA